MFSDLLSWLAALPKWQMLVAFWAVGVLRGLGYYVVGALVGARLHDARWSEARAKVQALNDFLVFGTVAVASFGSGRLLNTSGWETINTLMLPLIAVVLVMLGWLTLRHRRTTTSVTVTR